MNTGIKLVSQFIKFRKHLIPHKWLWENHMINPISDIKLAFPECHAGLIWAYLFSLAKWARTVILEAGRHFQAILSR